MLQRVHRWALCGLFVAGCSQSSSSRDVGTKEDDFRAGSDKADCFNCDEAGPGALQQVGLFPRNLAVGDKWLVAWKFRNTTQLQKDEPAYDGDGEVPGAARFVENAGDIALFAFEVKSVDAGGVVARGLRRETAVIEVRQADASEVPAQLSQARIDAATGRVVPGDVLDHTAQSGMRVDTYQRKLVLRMDDLLREVSRRTFTADHPNGLELESDADQVVRGGTDLFPVTVPNVDKAQRIEKGALPEDFPADLLAVAQKTRGAMGGTYRYFEIDGGREEVYWKPGDLWPSVTLNDRGAAVLVAQTLGQPLGQPLAPAAPAAP